MNQGLGWFFVVLSWFLPYILLGLLIFGVPSIIIAIIVIIKEMKKKKEEQDKNIG